jgi:DNA-binding NarL/FixJ family response regulator
MSVSHGVNSTMHDPTEPEARPVIFVIDPLALTLTCIAKALSSELTDLEVIGSAAAANQGRVAGRDVQLLAFNIADRAITDPTVLQDLEILEGMFPEAPVVILSTRDYDAATMEMLRQRGIKGFVPYSSPIGIAVAIIRLVLAGGVYFPQLFGMAQTASTTAVGAPIDSGTGDASRPPATAAAEAHQPATIEPCARSTDLPACILTARETEVLAQLRLGYPNKVIASELDIAENTVKMHIRRIMSKLHARNRTEAVLRSQHLLPEDVNRDGHFHRPGIEHATDWRTRDQFNGERRSPLQS